MRLCLAACDPACDHPPAPHVPLHASPSAPSAGESTSTQPSTLAQLAQIQRQMQQMVRAHAHVLTRLHEIETEHEIDERLLRSHEIGERRQRRSAGGYALDAYTPIRAAKGDTVATDTTALDAAETESNFNTPTSSARSPTSLQAKRAIRRAVCWARIGDDTTNA